MKKLLNIVAALMISTALFADASFDETCNFQFNNVQAYVGEILYLVPLTGSHMKVGLLDAPQEHYHHFMNFEQFDDDLGHECTMWQYKYDPFDYRDDKVAGTHKRHIEGHRFHVNKVVQIEDYTYMWSLYLTDLKTKEKVKYVYDGEKKNTGIDFENFPFVVDKHFKYLKSLIGTKLVFATNKYKFFLAESYAPIYGDTFKKDIKTGETITYTTPYVKWTIIDIILDVYESAIFFIVTNGENTTKVRYDNPYCANHPTYNIGNRVFPEKQWNALVAKYGEQHMSLIMQTEISNDMTIEEKYLAGGRKLAKAKETINQGNDGKQVIKKMGETVVKSTKETVKSIKEIGKGILGW
jgi:hypothetical protein